MLKSLRRLAVCANNSKKLIINNETFVKHNECFYISNDAIVKEKFIKKHHDDSLSKYFEVQKILNLI